MQGSGDTIFALSSGAGRAGIAVIRLSGQGTAAAFVRLAGHLPAPRRATVRRLCRHRDGLPIDQALVLWLPGPASYTGEDMAELHVHGGRAVVELILAELGQGTGFRLADPGEFTRRAFLNGKLDLTAAEGVADLIDAETEAQRRQAMRQYSGALRSVCDSWRLDLIEAMDLVEAAIDFSDEGDVPADVMAPIRPRLIDLCAAMAAHLGDGRRGEILRDGYHVMLAGAPNAGKSSLLNALAQRDAAIVSAEPGTTRDIIEVRLDLDGLPVVLSDTAGIRDPQNAIEREGIRRTLELGQSSDLIVWVGQAGIACPAAPPSIAAADSHPPLP